MSAVVLTLQQLHTESGDLSSEAGGLLLTFKMEPKQLSYLHLLPAILLPLHTLTLILQSPKLSLMEFPLKVDMALSRLQEIRATSSIYVSQYNNYVDSCTLRKRIP